MKKIFLLVLLCLSKGLMAQATNPVFSPSTGTYAGTVTVGITNSTTGSLFFCTTDGSTPDISSTQIVGSIVIHATTTLKCMAAVAGINQKNAQNSNPISSFWKSPPNCHCGSSGMPACTGVGYNNPGNGCQADDPGGTDVPASSTWSYHNATPSLSGNSMLFGETAQASKTQTNILFTIHGSFGACDSCTQFLETHDYYWPTSSNSSSDEDDMFSFDSTNSIRYMAGGQYCHAGCPSQTFSGPGWDFWGNSNIPWTNTGVTAGGTRGVWHHYQRYMYRIPAEDSSRPCSSAGTWPYIYIKYLAIDGVQYGLGNLTYPIWKNCANALPSGWASGAGQQAQIDIGNHSTSVSGTQYWDNVNFLATLPASSVITATYTIGSPSSMPQGVVSGRGTFSGNGAVIQ